MINEAKYLGIQIDKTLGWKEHVNIIAANFADYMAQMFQRQREQAMSCGFREG